VHYERNRAWNRTFWVAEQLLAGVLKSDDDSRRIKLVAGCCILCNRRMKFM